MSKYINDHFSHLSAWNFILFFIHVVLKLKFCLRHNYALSKKIFLREIVFNVIFNDNFLKKFDSIITQLSHFVIQIVNKTN